MEAIAAGVAQLATAIGGVPELVQKGITGELVPPGDPQALANAMADYIATPTEPGARARPTCPPRRIFRRRVAESRSSDLRAVLLRRSRPMPDRHWAVCWGHAEWPMMQTVSICHHLYRLEQPCPGVRLVWHEWADDADWEQAVLLWNWSADASDIVIQRALRSGVPVVAPSSCTAASDMETRFGAALTYKSYLEGMLVLARLPHDGAALVQSVAAAEGRLALRPGRGLA